MARRAVVQQRTPGERRVAKRPQDEVVDERQVRGAPDAGAVLGDVGDARVDRLPGGLGGDVLAVDRHASTAGPHAGDHLGQLRLPVAGDRGDADDLAGPDVERRAAQRRQPAVVVGRHVLDREHDAARLDRRAPELLEDRPADHQPGQIGPGHGLRVDAGRRHATCPHDGDPIGDRQHLTELVADEHDASPGIDHRPQRREELRDLLWREDGGRLVKDQDPRAVEQQLDDLDPLLLADRQLPDPRARVDAQPHLLGQSRDLRPALLEVEPEPGRVEAQQHVLRDRLRRHEREVLVDHPDAGRDRVARRAQVGVLPADPDATLIGTVQTCEHVHQRALAGAVLPEERVDLALAHVEIDVVVCEDAGERLDDADGLDRERRRRHGGVGTAVPVIERSGAPADARGRTSASAMRPTRASAA